MRAEGVLPPVKPKLNRRKFAKEVIKELENSFNLYSDLPHLREAISFMLPSQFGRVTPEEIGVVKVLKLAMEIKKYKEALIAKGETSYIIADFYRDVVSPVLKL